SPGRDEWQVLDSLLLVFPVEEASMPKFAANLTMMYTEHDFLDRFAAAAQDGFRAVEYLFPYDNEPSAIAQRLREFDLTQALFNLPPGDWVAGERGIAALPGREAEFAASVERALEYAHATGCRRLHAMAGLVPQGADLAAMRSTFVANLRLAAQRCAAHGITLLIEPINHRDMPGYFLNYQQQAHDIVADVGEPNLKVQMDWYHCQIMEGDIAMRLRRHLAGVGHVQIAGVPERHEPDSGELNYPYLFALLDDLGYDGYIGCEYRPRAGTSAGLGWFQPYKEAQR
ncbi:MAG TPA: 2-oxo-tetronate isomerase, partial [Pseudogulbenkiania sp.]|nr:2-oxo-tetronate isomerase [Pseudogulbenkiania sp.]